MNESCAIERPAYSLIGTRVRLLSSSVSVPFQPGSQKPAVAWTISPSRPIELFPSMRATMSSGSSTHSSVRPSANSPGWITNGTPSSTTTSSVRFDGGSRRSIAVVRWLWKTRKESPRRRSTDAGCTRSGSHGSIVLRPASTRRRIVPSDRTDWGAGSATAASVAWDAVAMADDDDWVGEPPEGRHTRDQAKPEFWRNQWQAIVATSILGGLVIVVVIIALLS